MTVVPAEPTAVVDTAAGTPAVIDFEVYEEPGHVLVSSSSLFTLDDPIVGSFTGSRFTSTFVRPDEARWSTLRVRHGALLELPSALVVVGFRAPPTPIRPQHGLLVLGSSCGLPTMPLGDKLVFVAPQRRRLRPHDGRRPADQGRPQPISSRRPLTRCRSIPPAPPRS